jgi:chemotaxis protein CheZ
MEVADRLELARKLVDALERGEQGDADHWLQSLSDQRSSQLLKQVAEMTREVHQAFGGLISDERLYEISKHAMPDARERLTYVVEKTEESAHRTLTAVEDMLALTDRLAASADAAEAEHADTAAFVQEARLYGDRLRSGLTEVLMAQEYQDLVGQVIKKTIDIVEQVELKLVTVLLAARPAYVGHEPARPTNGEATGPAIRKASDVMNHQRDVDDLLAALGV